MNLPDLGILALVEGVADLLPVDASAHSLLVSRLLGWRAGPLAAALHAGAALAVMSYFWRDMGAIAQGLWKLRKARIEAGTRLLAKMLMTAAPLILMRSGVLGQPPGRLGELFPVGLITMAMALSMLFADRLSLTVKRIEHIGIGTTLAIGMAQLLSLLTGVGRVAAGLTMARLFGMEREAAYRFTLLASLPVLIAASAGEILQNGDRHPGLSDALAATFTYGVVLLVLPLGFSLLRRAGLLPFVLYRLLFGAILVGLGLL